MLEVLLRFSCLICSCAVGTEALQAMLCLRLRSTAQQVTWSMISVGLAWSQTKGHAAISMQEA